jgi:hypothetical protein
LAAGRTLHVEHTKSAAAADAILRELLEAEMANA